MLATLTDKRFSDPRWIFERKFDGERCLAFRDGNRVRLLSRKRQSLNGTYPELVDALAVHHASRFVVDGEVVAFEGRRTSFARLQGRLGITGPKQARASRIRVYYYLFDLLHLDGQSTTALPLIWRKRLLSKTFQFTDPLRYAIHRVQSGEIAYRAACARGEEGVSAKLADATYEGRRSTNWLKFKCVRDQEFVIGGYTAPKGSRVGLGAVLVGDGRHVIYAGKVGTGFDDTTLRRLHERLSAIEQDACHSPAGRSVRPEPDGYGRSWWPRLGSPSGLATAKLRHPCYPGLRTDKNPDEVVRETR